MVFSVAFQGSKARKSQKNDRIDAKHSAIIINCLADGKQLTVANYI